MESNFDPSFVPMLTEAKRSQGPAGFQMMELSSKFPHASAVTLADALLIAGKINMREYNIVSAQSMTVKSRAIVRPLYRNTRIDKFDEWCLDNSVMLDRRWTDLGRSIGITTEDEEEFDGFLADEWRGERARIRNPVQLDEALDTRRGDFGICENE